MADKSESSISGAQADDIQADDLQAVDTQLGKDTQGEDSQAAETPAGVGDGASDADAGPWGASDTAPDSVENDSLAGSEGADSLTGGSADDVVSEPLSSTDADREPAQQPAAKSGGGGFLITVIIVALVGVGLYTTYPVWRPHAVPYAEQFGIALPEIPGEEVASAASAPAQESAQAPEQTAQQAPSPAPAPAPAPAVDAAEVDALTARLDALAEQVETLTAAQTTAAPVADTSGLEAEIETLAATVTDTRSTLSTFGDELAILRDNLGSADGGEGIGPFAAELSKKLQGFEDKITALEAAQTAPGVTPEDLAAVTASVGALSTRLDEAFKAADTAREALSARMDAVDGVLEDLKAAVATTRSRSEQAGAFLIASNQLALAGSRSGAFAAELDAVAAVGGSASEEVGDAVSRLRPLSSGVPSRAVLRDRFAQVASDILDASRVGSGEDMVGAALRNVASLVTVRRTTTSDGDSLDSLVTGAENAVRAGDLQAAVDALSSLEGDTASAAAGWLSDARDRLAVDQAVGVLQSAAIANLAGG
jgi:hypothetical protein